MHCQHGTQQSADDRDAVSRRLYFPASHSSRDTAIQIPPYTPSMTTLVDPGSKLNFFCEDFPDTIQAVGLLRSCRLYECIRME